jgi:hypothetical protein
VVVMVEKRVEKAGRIDGTPPVRDSAWVEWSS